MFLIHSSQSPSGWKIYATPSRRQPARTAQLHRLAILGAPATSLCCCAAHKIDRDSACITRTTAQTSQP
eukprot:2684002-Rhodomonas_salina.1